MGSLLVELIIAKLLALDVDIHNVNKKRYIYLFGQYEYGQDVDTIRGMTCDTTNMACFRLKRRLLCS